MNLHNTCGFVAAVFPGRIGLEELAWYVNLLFGLWLWLFGANVGSFMNVVVYRLPRGSSITLPRSRCPRCGHKIRWYDNIPVLSWLLLRAKCRDCMGPISTRYPLVEFLVGSVFVFLVFFGPMYGGADKNIPDFVGSYPYRQQTMLTMAVFCSYQLVLWCTVVCAALMSFDGRSVPRSLFVPAIIVGVAAPVAWPAIRPVPFATTVSWQAAAIAAADGAAGLVLGATLGVLIHAAASRRRRARRNPAIMPLALVGLYLGWQSVCAISMVAIFLELFANSAARLFGRGVNRIALTAPLCVVQLAYVVFWKPLLERVSGLGADATILTFVLAAAFVSGLSFVQSLSRSRTRTTGRQRLDNRPLQADVNEAATGLAPRDSSQDQASSPGTGREHSSVEWDDSPESH